MTERLEGRFQGFLFQSPDGSWGVGILRDQKGAEHKITGAIMATPGQDVVLEGDWTTHARFGRQFKIKNCVLPTGADGNEKLPADATGIIGYLERLPNIGPTRARTIYREFKDQAFEVLEKTPERLAEAPGITPRMTQEIHDVYMAERGRRDMIVFLKGFDLTDNKIAKIMATYKGKLKKIITEQPYQMIADIHGFGFKIVDEIAIAAGVKRDDPMRIEAGLLYALTAAEDDGHTYLPKDELLANACNLLQAPARQINEAIMRLVENKGLIQDGPGIYSPDLMTAEKKVVKALFSVAQGGFVTEKETLSSNLGDDDWTEPVEPGAGLNDFREEVAA